MNLKEIFAVTKEMAQLAKEYEDISFECQNEELKKAYADFVSKLDEYHSRILGLAKFYPKDKIEKKGVNTVAVGELPSYCQITVLHEYPHENLVLVEDTGMGLHLIPLDVIKFE